MKFIRNIPQVLYFPLFIVAVVLTLTVLKANGSSVSMYNMLFYGDYGKEKIIGTPRSIRSDEWMVQTVRLMAQYQTNYPETNPLFGTGLDFTLTRLPVRNWTALFRPQHWGFWFLPIEYAFSFYWWFRAALLILSFYLILLWITGRKIIPSALLALIFFYSPFIQWWYSGPLIEMLAYSILLLVVFCKLVNTPDWKQLILYSLLFTYLSACFAILKYPPFQIPLAYCMGLLGMGYLLNNSSLLSRESLKRIVPAFALSLVLVAGIVLFFYFSFKTSIDITKDSVYPGHRFFTGGDLNPLYLFGGFFDLQFLADNPKIPPALGANQSEASSFLLFSLFILPVIVFGEVWAFYKRRKPDWLAILACVYMIILLIWVFWGFPKVITNITLFKYVGSRRVLIGFGVINILVIAYYLFRYRQDFSKDKFRYFAAIYAFLIFVVYAYVGWRLRVANPKFIPNNWVVLSIALIAGILLYFLLIRYQKPFLWLFFAVSLVYTFFVNPISFGLAPILNSDFSLAIQEIRKTEPPTAKWVAYDSLIIGNYLVANGAPALDASYVYPDLKLWQEFDPNQEYKNIYNRQGHVIFQRSSSDQAKFVLKQPDLFYVVINPCSPVFKQVGVVFYVFSQPVSYSCLEPISTLHYPKMEIDVYKRIK